MAISIFIVVFLIVIVAYFLDRHNKRNDYKTSLKMAENLELSDMYRHEESLSSQIRFEYWLVFQSAKGKMFHVLVADQVQEGTQKHQNCEHLFRTLKKGDTGTLILTPQGHFHDFLFSVVKRCPYPADTSFN
jgi:hypothetical protein